jgi:hypothetical protein
MQKHHRTVLMNSVHQKHQEMVMPMVVVVIMMKRFDNYSLHRIQVQKMAVH